jgi:hypothetical protein
MSARRCIEPPMRAYTDLMTTILNMAGLFGPTPPQFNEDALVAGMERHNAAVRAHVPARQLLEWSPADGWGRCASSLNGQYPLLPCHT